MELSRGSRLLHYEVRDRLGKGGMGEVYRARDTRLNREVALKVLPADLAGSADRRMRFEREAQAVAALNHPNIVTIHSVEEADGTHFLTMELVQGRTLTQLVPHDGIALDRIFEIAVPLADALAAAHGKGITHRDLKPDNVMVTDEGRVKVLDFGLAKLAESADAAGESVAATQTAEGQILGTIAYMAPEQAEGKSVDARSDVFALGVLLYEMASGKRPFEGETRISTLTAILRDTPPSLSEIRQDLPRHLTRIVNRCVSKEPDRRYASALDVRNELEALRREGESSGVSPAPSIPQATSTRRPGPIVGILAIVALAVVGILWLLGRDSPAPIVPADRPADRGPVAVLGFDHMGAPSDDEQLSRMLVGLITTGLADSGGIEVVSTAKVLTSLKKAGAADGGFDPTLAVDAARLAGAGTMVVGQVMQNGEQLLLTAELVDVASGNTLGSMRAEGAGKSDLFAMAGSIATAVRGKLGGDRLEEGLAIDLAQSLTDSADAYGLYAAGQLATHESRFDDAIEELTQSIRADPTFALAYYELAMAQLWHGDRAGALRNLHNGLQYIDRLPPRWQTTYQAVIDYEAGNAENAIAALEELVAQSPEMPDPYNYLAEVLTHFSQYVDWLRTTPLFRRALELDPTYKVVLFHLVDDLLLFEGPDAARAVLDGYRDDRDPSVVAATLEVLFHERRYADIVALEQDPTYDAERLLEILVFPESLFRTGDVERALELSARNVEKQVGYMKGIGLWYDAHLALRIGRFRQALEQLSAGSPLYDSPAMRSIGANMRTYHALTLELLGEVEAAVDLARGVRDVDYFHAQSRFEAARLLYSLDRIEEGDQELEGLEVLVRDGHSPYPACWLELARAAGERARGRPGEALDLLRRDLPRDCRAILRYPCELLLARTQEDAGDLEQALRHFRTLKNPPSDWVSFLPWKPGDVNLEWETLALYDVARLEQQTGRPEDARRHYGEFLEHWGNADVPVPIVEQARRQLAALGGS